MKYNLILDYLKENLTKHRYEHTIRVVDMSIKIAEKYNYENIDKVKIAAYLHDCAKNLSKDKMIDILNSESFNLTDDIIKNVQIFHGKVGAILAKRIFNIQDEEILLAIESHTFGRENMSVLDKIIFLGDAVEMGRDYGSVDEIRSATFESLDLGLYKALNHSIKSLIKKDKYVYPQILTVRNEVLNRLG